MKKSLLFFFIFCLGGINAFSEEVSRERAEAVANSFIVSKMGFKSNDLTLTLKSNENAWYLFSNEKAWVLVSGETNLYPVLAFSTEAGIDATNIPDAMKSYLDARDNQYLVVRNKRSVNNANQAAWVAFEKKQFNVSGTQEAMEPLVKTRWNQDYPYNMFCPEHSEGPGGHTYAGCVATAMSQVMKYHNYPETGRFTKSYFWGENVEVDFSQGNYEWDLMTNTINDNSREAIAKLMYHCGVSVNMDYGYDGSGTQTAYTVFALKQYFNYKSGLHYEAKENYSDAEWKFMLKEDLDKKHPIIYSGSSTESGHAFVCDAYQDTTYFHFNFGWGGAGDGFFHVDTTMQFGWNQAAVLNIIPYHGEYCNSMVYTQQDWSFDDGSGPNYYWNDSDCEWLIKPEGTLQKPLTLNFEKFDTEEGDILFVYDGENETAPLIGQYSGSGLPESIVASGNALFLRFVTDEAGQKNGWKVNYESSVVSGIEDENIKFELYPNPAENILHVNFMSNEGALFEMIDVTGRVVKTKQLENMKNNIDVSDMQKGLYVVKIFQSGKFVQKSIVVN